MQTPRPLAGSRLTSVAGAIVTPTSTAAQPPKPVILVGTKGVTPALLAELNSALEHHELIKVKIAAEDRAERDVWVAGIVKGADAALIQRVGNVATIFRPRRKNPGIVLPR